VLTEQQREEKKAAEGELAFARSELEKEVDPTKSKLLREDVTLLEKKLDELMVSFEVRKRSTDLYWHQHIVLLAWGYFCDICNRVIFNDVTAN